VLPGSDAETRLQRRAAEEPGEGQLVLNYSDSNLMADELASYGPEVVVLEPAHMRDRVVQRLRRVAADHEGAGR
jgi:proteasome accessory factor B